MKQPNANAKLKLKYRILDKLFRFLKKHARTILICLVVVLVAFVFYRLVVNKIDELNIFKKIGSFFSNTFNSVKDGVSNAWNGVTGKASDIWSSVTGIFS